MGISTPPRIHDPAVGTRQLSPLVLDTLQGTLILKGGDGAIVSIRNPDQPLLTEIFTAVENIDLEIDHVTLPAEPGTQSDGVLRGSVAFEAAGVVIERDPGTHTVRIVGPASESTLRVYVEFETSLYELLVGRAQVRVTMDGNTFSIGTGGGARIVEGGAHYHLSGIAPTPDGGFDGDRILFQTRVEATGPGTVSFETLDGDTFDPRVGASGTWSYASMLPGNLNVAREEDITGYAYSTGGEVVLAEYRAPTSTAFGLMRGISTIAYELRDEENAPTGDTFEATTEFVLPIEPLCSPFAPPCD